MRSKTLSNPLGDIRAEADHKMLVQAFYETPDYLSLLDSDDKIVVIGRRGTGKSALTYRLKKQWLDPKGAVLVVVAPEEHHFLALAPLIEKTGSKFLSIKACCRLLWRYGLLLEIMQMLASRYKAKDAINSSPLLAAHLTDWGRPEQAFFEKLRFLTRKIITTSQGPDDVIGLLSDALDISKIEKAAHKVLENVPPVKILVDRLDEGFDPTTANIAFVDGAITAAIDLATIFKNQIRPIVFLRDNIFRAVAHFDQDYSRNIEGQALRLHWDVNNLFYLVCNRIRAAFDDTQQNNKRLWNKYVSHELQGDDGFKQCLKYTLYRPRDILILLNSAFENASKRDLTAEVITIGIADLEKSARTISINRLDDLTKEYRQIFHTIEAAVSIFANRDPEMSLPEACNFLEQIINQPQKDIESQIEIAIFSTPEELVRSLYGVGFFGTYDNASSSYVFSHDGKRQDVEFAGNQKLLIHPCYWMALNLTKSTWSMDDATEINDEYEIKVASVTPQIRNSRLGKLIAEYSTIQVGHSDSAEFERWCLEAIKICFAGKLDNISLHPNGGGVNRRDVLGTNLSKSAFWKRVHEDYDTRQVIFEVKNYDELTSTDYRQLNSYMSGRYGNLAFFVTRDWRVDLEREKELAYFKSVYNDHKKMIVKLTGKFLADILSKMRNPQKHDASDLALTNLLDRYERMYLSQQSGRTPSKSNKTRN